LARKHTQKPENHSSKCQPVKAYVSFLQLGWLRIWGKTQFPKETPSFSSLDLLASKNQYIAKEPRQ